MRRKVIDFLCNLDLLGGTHTEREREKEKSVILQYVVIYERQKEKKTK